MYCLRVFIVALQELHCLLQCFPQVFWCVHSKASLYQVSSHLVIASVSYMPIYVPTVPYGLRLFIVVLQEVQCFVSIIRVIGFYHFTKFCSSTYCLEKVVDKFEELLASQKSPLCQFLTCQSCQEFNTERLCRLKAETKEISCIDEVNETTRKFK